MATVADVLRHFGAAYLTNRTLSTPQAKAWRGMVACRTSALGGQQLACDACGHSHWQYHSCRNRHCPQCGARAKDAWLQGRLAEVLPVPYAHMVFTLPHDLNGLYGAHPRWVIDTLFACTAKTLNEFAANARWMGTENGTPAFSLVLHTWTQDLHRHIHLHAVVACGVLQGQSWHTPVRKPEFLFPVQALSKVYRGKFLQSLTDAHRSGEIERDPQGDEAPYRQRHRALYRHDWVVYAKAALGGPTQVLEYLSRYTHRTAIGNERIGTLTEAQVAFTVRADDGGGKRLIRLDGAEFIGRLMLHVLPTGIKRIRHYGVLAAACKGTKLDAARQALQMPALNPQASESARDFMARVARAEVLQCPCCKLGRLRCVAQLAASRHLPVPGSPMMPANRGPP